jgi:aerobic carbon-monoxide dehydrogenase small subunit
MSDQKGQAMPLQLTINGEERTAISDPLTPLVDVLRDEFSLTGAKIVCREGFCGACMVLIDGKPAVSCLLPAGLAEGRDIRTVESLSAGGDLSPLQRALEEHDVVQCGMCFPGIVISLTGYLAHTNNPDREGMKAALVGNICRCTGYERVVDAALSLAQCKEAR